MRLITRVSPAIVLCLSALWTTTVKDSGFRYGRGTTAVLIRSSRVVIAGIDSRETWMQYREGETHSDKSDVCKGAKVGPDYVLAAGLDRGDGYSALSEAVHAWQPTDTLDTLAARVGERVTAPLVSLLTRIRTIAPEDFMEHFQGRTVLQMSFVGVENRTPKVVILELSERENSSSSLNLALRTIRCPGNCPASSTAYFLGTHGEIDEAVRRNPDLISPPAERNVTALIHLESLDRPDAVGGPVAIVAGDRSGIAMVSPGACATESMESK